MKYFEKTEHDGRQLCRIENFVPYHKALCDLLTGPTTIAVLAKLFGEDAVLFKEKINFKLAGGVALVLIRMRPPLLNLINASTSQ